MEFAMGDEHEERAEGLVGRNKKLQNLQDCALVDEPEARSKRSIASSNKQLRNLQDCAMVDEHEARSKRSIASSNRQLRKRKISGEIETSVKMLKGEMREIGEQQKRIRAGQKEIRNKFGEIESECDQLKKKTLLISEQAAGNQHRLDLMSQILKAREQNNLHEAAKLTQSLRECMMKQNKKSNP